MEKILVIDNYDSFTYNLVHYIESNPNFKVDVFRNDEISLDDVDQYNTIVLSPGPGLPKDAGILKALIAKYASSKKILGVCLGMQAIAEVFGGQLENLNTVYHGVASRLSIKEKDNPLFVGLPENFDVGRYHSWVLKSSELPANLIVTSVEDKNQVMSISHKKI